MRIPCSGSRPGRPGRLLVPVSMIWMGLGMGCTLAAATVGSSTQSPAADPARMEEQVLGVLAEMRRTGKTYLSVSESTGRMLRLLTEATGARHVVEIGTSTGYSGLWFALALSRTGGKLTTFEIDSGRAAQAQEHFRRAGVDGHVEIVLGDAHVNVIRLKEPIDILFLDADKSGYTDYLQKLLPLVRPGGLIVADNINMAPDYERAVTTDPRLETIYWREGGQVSITLKKR
jgi:caffeoyl-CoA O-methyltransferase